MTYPIIRIKALGDRRFEVLPARDADRKVSGCSTENFEILCDLFDTKCGPAYPICSKHKVIFKEILK